MVRARRTLLLAAALVLAAGAAHAASVLAVDDIVRSFKTNTGAWAGTLKVFALGTFGLLAVSQFAYSMYRVGFARHEPHDLLAELVNQALFIGIFLFLLLNAVTLGSAIINTFRFVAGKAGAVPVSPGEVLSAGINMANQGMIGAAHMPWSAMPGAILCCVLIEALFALMTARLLLTVVKSYYWVNVGVWFFGFGGSQWTKEFALSMLRHIVSIGAELFTLQLILSLCMVLVDGWVAPGTPAPDLSGLFAEIGIALVMAVLVWELPREAQAMISGSAISGAGLVGAAASLAGAVAGAGAIMAGAGAIMGQAVRLADAQTKAADALTSAATMGAGGAAPAERGRISHAAAVTGRALGNVAMAPVNDLGRRLSGQGAPHGSAPWRMAADMGNKARLLKGDAAKPQPKGGNP